MRLARFLSAVLAVLMLSGCWDVRDINDRTTTLALGVDRAQGRWVVTAANIKPQGSATTTYQTEFVAGSGSTLYDAFDNLQNRTARRFYLGTVSTIVLGEEVIKRGTDVLLDLLMQKQQNSIATFLITTPGRADAFLTTPEKTFGSMAVRIYRHLRSEDRSVEKFLPITVWKALSLRLGPGHSFWMPVFAADNSGEVTVVRTVVKGPDHTPPLYLSRDQTEALRWLANLSSRDRLTIDGAFQVRTQSTARHFTFSRTPSPHIRADVGATVELYNTPSWMITTGMQRHLSALTAKRMWQRTAELLSLLREHGVDPLGFREMYVENGLDPAMEAQAPVELTVHVRLAPRETAST